MRKQNIVDINLLRRDVWERLQVFPREQVHNDMAWLINNHCALCLEYLHRIVKTTLSAK